MIIAHLSDLHLYAPGRVPWRRFVNKRFTGWVNLRVRRNAVHRPSYVRAIAREIARLGAEHVVVTGDLTNLALEAEYELARELLQEELGFDRSRITVVPGNHDLYTRGALVSKRFDRYFDPWLQSDLPELAVETHGGRFPIVKLRGSVAVVGLSSAVPRPPFVAAGELGRAQIIALARVLTHPEVTRRTVVLAMHHPLVHGWSRMKTHLEGLRDAPALLALLASIPHGLLLHGHMHRRIHRELRTSAGRLGHIGATSASLHDEEAGRMAGFNVYELDEGGLARVRAHVYSPEVGSFRVESVPKYV